MYTKARAYLYKQTLLPNHPYNSLKNTYVSIEKHSTGERFFFLPLFEEEALLTFFFQFRTQSFHKYDTRETRARSNADRHGRVFEKRSAFIPFAFVSFSSDSIKGVLCLGTKRLVKGIREAALSSILSVSTRAGGKRGGSRPAVVRETPTTRVNTSRDEAQLSIGPVVHVHRETNHGTGEILPRVTHRIGIEVVLGEVILLSPLVGGRVGWDYFGEQVYIRERQLPVPDRGFSDGTILLLDRRGATHWIREGDHRK